MEPIRPASMEDVVEQWLRAELESSRFGPRLAEALEREGRDASALDDPAFRLRLLTSYRQQPGANGPEHTYVDGIPIDAVDWWWATASRAELADVLYIDWAWWLEVTGGSRRPADFVDRLLAEQTPPYDEIEAIAARLRRREAMWPMILVDSGPGTRVVVVEGHFRLTGHVLAGADGPARVEVLFGRSPLVADWVDY